MSTNETTELVFILDRSGSMSGLEADTIGGYNATIEKQRALPGSCRVTCVLFDDAVKTISDRTDITELKNLTSNEYFVGGCTALLDAMGSTIKRINQLQKSDSKGRPDHTIFVITTDGMENASRSFSFNKVRALVEKHQKKHGWEFVFMGANIDAIGTASDLGIHADRATNYVHDSQGTAMMHEAVNNMVCASRMNMQMGSEWKRDVEADYASRR